MPTALRGHGRRRPHAHAKPWAWHTPRISRATNLGRGSKCLPQLLDRLRDCRSRIVHRLIFEGDVSTVIHGPQDVENALAVGVFFLLALPGDLSLVLHDDRIRREL